LYGAIDHNSIIIRFAQFELMTFCIFLRGRAGLA
jgi:hypothetical protein